MSFGGGFGGPIIPPIPQQPSGRYGYGPSRYVLRNKVDIYTRIPTKDTDRATVPIYQLGATSIPCSVQPGEIISRYDANEAVIQFIPYAILFGRNPALPQYAYVNWMDDAAIVHKIIVIGTRSYAGRGVMFVIDGEERV